MSLAEIAGQIVGLVTGTLGTTGTVLLLAVLAAAVGVYLR